VSCVAGGNSAGGSNFAALSLKGGVGEAVLRVGAADWGVDVEACCLWC
jgi:hypothetical protein